MTNLPGEFNRDSIQEDLGTVRDAVHDLSFLPAEVKQIVLPRSDYERLVKAAGNLAGGATALIGTNEAAVSRLARVEVCLQTLVSELDGFHFISEANPMVATLAIAKEIVAPQPGDKTEN
jgi:hypothetical protein